MKNSYIFLLFLTILMLSGCARVFSVGDSETYCNEHGCNYVDVGVCANPVDILKNKNDLEALDNKSLVRKAK